MTQIPQIELRLAELDQVCGGMDVQIGNIATDLNGGDSTIGKFIGSIVKALQDQAGRNAAHGTDA
jgi:hypothetical protein